MTLKKALKAAKDLSHDLDENESPSTISVAMRRSCKKCGRTVINYNGNIYGSATTDACSK